MGLTFEVLKVVKILTVIFWLTMPYGCQCFKATFHTHLWGDALYLKMVEKKYVHFHDHVTEPYGLINCGREKLNRPIIFNFTQLFKKDSRTR
jgi:hypothetical protein